MKSWLFSLRLAFVSCLVVLNGCSEDEQPASTEPTVETGNVKVEEVGGALFSGHLTRHESLADHGFFYGQDSLLKMPLTRMVSMGKPGSSGEFEYDLAVGLKKSEVYFFRAYIEHSGIRKYGNIKSFFSNGSVPPVIDRVTPEKGHLGEKIVIVGKNFGSDPYYTQVRFGDIRPEGNFIVSDTAIIVNIPRSLVTDQFKVTVTVFDKAVEVPYQLQSPEIHSIDPESVTFRDIITVRGAHFDTIPERNEVLLGDVNAIVVSSTRNEIKFIVPDELQLGSPLIKIKSQLQESIAEETFSLIDPQIYEFPESAASDTHFEVNGAFFNPTYNLNRVFFGDTEATVTGGNTNILQLTVPYGPFPLSKGRIKIQVADIVVEAEKEVYITDDWVMISKSLPFNFFNDIGTFSFPDRGYVISRSGGEGEMYLWEFDPDQESWTKSDLPFPSSVIGGISADNGQKGYVYFAGNSDNFWEFDPKVKQWKKLPDFPGAPRTDATMFCIGNAVYVGIGRQANSWDHVPYRDFYKYNAATRQWGKIKDLVLDPYFGRLSTSVFVIGNHAYLAGGALHSGQNDAWKYFPDEDRWEQIAELPDAYNMTSHFSINGKGYISNSHGEVWEYNPETNTWNEFYKVGHYGRYEAFAFVTKGQAYLGGGATSFVSIPDTGKELYRLNK